MNYLQAKQTATKLFGPGVKLHRGKHKCFVLLPNGMPIGDGRSWLEALRSAGEMAILRNEKRRVEENQLKEALAEYVKATGYDPNKMTEEQLAHFDRWMAERSGLKPSDNPIPIMNADINENGTVKLT